jgi:hypothetical protein
MFDGLTNQLPEYPEINIVKPLDIDASLPRFDLPEFFQEPGMT